MKHKDLCLHYKFTDRGGASVYDIYLDEDRMRMDNILGEIRIKDDTVTRMTLNLPGVQAGGTG